MAGLLSVVVVVAAGGCLISLSVMVLRMARFGKPTSYINPAGNAQRGIVYAFGRGMLPWAKESARHHMATYVSGIIYHVSTFTALVYIVFVVTASSDLERRSLIFVIAVVPGFLAGTMLLLRRLLTKKLRAISCPDDYVSNALVDALLGLVVLDALHLSVRAMLLVVSIVLFVTIPLGKIRHCFFFFYMRILFGRFYGSRGVLPHDQRRSI